MKKLHVKKGIDCMSCLSCALACSKAYYKVEDPARSAIQIVSKKDDINAGTPSICVQCGKCAKACPNEAITQNKFGVYMVDRKKCTGCGECVAACPFGVMLKTEDNPYATKCIACGLCVKACPVEMLEIISD